MTQDQWLTLADRIVLICAFITLTSWAAVDLRLTRGRAWKNPVGKSLLLETLLIAAVCVPSALSVFLHLSRRDNEIVGWVDVALIGIVTPVMAQRIVVWFRLYRSGKAGGQDPPGDGP